MFLATVSLFLTCIEITSSSSTSFCLQFDQTRTWWLCCTKGFKLTQTCFVSTPAATIVKSYSLKPLWTMITTMFQEKSNSYHISEKLVPKLVPLRSLSSSFIDSFSVAMRRCNTSQGFGAFFVQSCDRFLFPFSLFSHFSFSLLIFFKLVVMFLIRQLFYSGLLDIKWL